MSWHDAYEERTTIFNFWRSAQGAAFARGYARDVEEKGRSAEAHFLRNMNRFEADKMLSAKPVWVDGDMCDLITAASTDFEPEPLHPDDLLMPSAFVLFEKPMYFNDMHGKKVSYRAVAWVPSVVQSGQRRPSEKVWADDMEEVLTMEGAHGLTVSFYSRWDDKDDYNEQWARERAERPDNPLWRWPLTPSHVGNWQYGVSYRDMTIADTDANFLDDDTITEEQIEAYGSLWAQTQVLMKLMMQKVSTVETRPAPRPARRRAQREKLPGSDVTVVTLRRLREAAESTGESYELTHRFLVSGHWRNQPYGPAREYRRQQWISAYIKGPEGTELRIKERAYQLVR